MTRDSEGFSTSVAQAPRLRATVRNPLDQVTGGSIRNCAQTVEEFCRKPIETAFAPYEPINGRLRHAEFFGKSVRCPIQLLQKFGNSETDHAGARQRYTERRGS